MIYHGALSLTLATTLAHAAAIIPRETTISLPSSTEVQNYPIVRPCMAPGVVCLKQHAANLPYPFYRAAPDGRDIPTYGDTKVPADASWQNVSTASFIVFDESRAAEVLGDAPSVEFVFSVDANHIHESPVFVPTQNRIYFSELSTNLPQLTIDLNQDPPTLSQFTADPPIYIPNGGFYHNNTVYFSVAGSNASIPGLGEQRPGIVTLDPATNKSTTLLDNYYGMTFTDCDDLIVDPETGFIWFTSPYYSWWLKLADIPPQLKSGTYRFDPATGSTVIANDDMFSPNGIALSADRRHMYISDSAASGLSAPISPDVPSPGGAGILYNITGTRTIYKFDLVDDGRAIINKRPIYYDAIGSVPDGLKVARNGYVVTAAGNGLSVMDEYGDMIVRVQANFTVNNFIWSDANGYREVWMVGMGGVARLKWGLQGQEAV
ncbi:lactonohydrolase [Aspergillus bombycis]|uniref:Lactonohydrolase n=1 Tax=Aspergillus bombycis TaxID=109264 RepID=A0A1F8A312_9EURO|nr:lactonohydrolase [Aspergillus bombycis]OGM46077.1 lactonohydrolase [Aspergillus bombycis]